MTAKDAIIATILVTLGSAALTGVLVWGIIALVAHFA